MKLLMPKFWSERNYISAMLYPVSLIYIFFSKIRSYLQSLNKYKTKAKIIRIGNLTLGGAGKTPTAIAISKMFPKHKVAFLSRGYKGSLEGPIMVNGDHNFLEVGDEPLLLSKAAPTCVCKDRLKGIKFLEEQGFELIITDDGMQDNRFTCNLTILVIDLSFGFGNGLIFPAGPLRESIEMGEKKADFAVVIGEGDIEVNLPKFRAKFTTKSSLDEHRYVAFAGIANPDKFFKTLENAGGEIIKRVAFADHYQYTQKDMEHLTSFGWKLITTEKDFVRIPLEYKKAVEIFPVELVFENQRALQNLLNL